MDHLWVDPGTADWWEQQDVPSAQTKDRVTAALHRVEFVDGSVWTRKGWKPEDLPRPDAITKGVRDGRCGAL